MDQELVKNTVGLLLLFLELAPPPPISATHRDERLGERKESMTLLEIVCGRKNSLVIFTYFCSMQFKDQGLLPVQTICPRPICP